MFENLRKAFREAVDNFNTELNRDEIPEVVDGLLRQMQEEITDATANLHLLEEQIKKAIQLADMEEKEVATCVRREEMALRIGDEETARIAREFADKHRKKKEIQQHKALALRDELEMKRGEVEDMMEKLKVARTKREALSATSGRASARNSMGEADDLFAQLDRMAEQIEGADHHRAAEEELISELDGLGNDPGYRSRSPEEEAELRLRELKRRMGKE